ncbi:LysR family transcriptional regulator [Burkholderia sp. AU31624]|uniref:LysR family transcriptional regulator n=1 Tax=unclassified Burkholderia TaxID=2613784 RepID=UPI0015C61958|nr:MULTISPECIES: LysR family transcriptional regulator [unclassified Burkholderia]MCA8060797.1 LysR family transcriptional regulator [Burkholderia sp. AU38729]MCA8252573.1 LysR family transcriptional regulator [Burkholderia sp. AU31624]
MSEIGSHLIQMSTFVRIVEAGSLSVAAKQLNTSQPTVSRHLRALENHLETQLLIRSTHGMNLTEAGKRYYEYARGLIGQMAEFEEEMRGQAFVSSGTLRVVVPTAIGQEWLIELADQYLKACPEMRLEWRLSDGSVNFEEDAIDCVIRAGEPEKNSYVARPLGELRRVLAAAPSVVRGYGEILTPEDLSKLPWIAMTSYYINGIDLRDRSDRIKRVEISPRFALDHVLGAKVAARLGIGAVLISEWMVLADFDDGKLVRLLPDWWGTSLPLYAVYPKAKFYPAKLRQFVGIAEDVVARHLGRAQVLAERMRTRELEQPIEGR